MSSTLKAQARWFLRQMRPLFPSYSLGVLLVVLSSAMFLLDPLLLKWLIDYVLPKKDFRLLLLTALGFFGLYIFRLGFLEGRPGLIASQLRCQYISQVRAKIYESKRLESRLSENPRVS